MVPVPGRAVSRLRSTRTFIPATRRRWTSQGAGCSRAGRACTHSTPPSPTRRTPTTAPARSGIRLGDGPIGSIVAASVPSVGAGLDTIVAISGLWQMAADEYAEVTFYQGTGANLKITAIRFSFAFLTPAP